MKSFYLLIIFFISSSITAQDYDSKFTVSCRVVDSIVLSIKQGQAERFSGYTGGLSIGDYLKIDFIFDAYYSENEGNDFFSLSVHAKKLEFAAVVGNDDYSTTLNEAIYYESTTGDVAFSRGDMSIEGIGGVIKAKRYHRDDWTVTFSSARGDEAYVMTANCLNVSQQYNSLLNRLEKFDKN